MRFTPLLGAALAPLLAGTVGAQQDTIDAGRGPVPLYVPADYDAGTPTPLVVLLHALGQTGESQELYFRLSNHVDTHGFLYATPTGTGGSPFWNATDACCDVADTGIDDVTYLIALIDAIAAAYHVDGTRVYLVGHSNGGFMAYRMACEHPERFAAIVSLAGATWDDPADCVNGAPVHVLQIHGTEDDAILYGGGIGPAGGTYPGALETVEQWALAAGCALAPEAGPARDIDSGLPGNETSVLRFVDGCDAEGSAELWTIQGGGHNPSLSAQFPRSVVEFLLAHSKPCGDVEAYCAAAPNSTGLPAAMGWTGTTSVSANDFVLSAQPIPAAHSAVFVYSPDEAAVPLGNGVLCLGTATLGFVARFLPVQSDGAGRAVLEVDWTRPTAPEAQVGPGETWHFSCWYRDPQGGGAFFNFADGLRIAFCP